MTPFPIGLTHGPPVGSKTPAGRDGLDEVAKNGVTFVRTGIPDWRGEFLDGQITEQRKLHTKLRNKGLKTWLWLGDLPDLPGPHPPNNEQMLTKIVNAFKGDASLLAWKAYDEPRNPFRGADWIRPAGLVRAYEKIKALDPHHPVVLIHAPPSPVAHLRPYAAACDVSGADIYPIAYPPGLHAGGSNRDINVVGDIARKVRAAGGGKPFWVTILGAWGGMTPAQD